MDDARPAREIPGVSGAIVEYLESDGLLAAVSAMPSNPEKPDIRQLERFHAVVAELHRSHPVIPLRWGQFFPDREQARQALHANADHYRKTLRRVAGCVEMSIRALVPDTGGEKGTPQVRPHREAESAGKRFLESRRAEYGLHSAVERQHARLESACRNAFSGLCRAQAGEPSNTPMATDHHLATLYFLVPRQQLQAFRAAYRRLAEEYPLKLLLTGPWPPYNFVS